MLARFIIYDNKLIDKRDLPINNIFQNQYFELSEKIWYSNDKLPLFDEHILLIQKKIEILNLTKPVELSNPGEILRLTRRMLVKNKAFKTGIINLKFFWKEQETGMMAACSPLSVNFYEHLNRGILLRYTEAKKYSEGIFPEYGFTCELLWNILKIRVKNHKYDGYIIENNKGVITETIESNIYFIKNNVLFTPSIHTGCYIDPIREKILESAIMLDMKVLESPKLDRNSVSGMDESFIASEIKGIRKVMGIENKRFTHLKTELINKKLYRFMSGSSTN